MLTLRHCDASLRVIQSDVHIGKIIQRIFADTKFDPLKRKLHSVVMVGAEDDVFWFVQFLLLFQLIVSGAYLWSEDCFCSVF